MSKRRNPNRVPEIAQALADKMIMTTSDFKRGVKINITSINGVRFNTPEETTRIASKLAGIPLTPHRKRVSTIIKDQTRYKNPIFPTIKQTARVVSKTGKVYYRTFVTQDVELEHAFRSLQWQWNKKGKKSTNNKVRGKITSPKMEEYFRKNGRQGTLNYIKSLTAIVNEYLPVGETNSLRIMIDGLEDIATRNPDMKDRINDIVQRLMVVQSEGRVNIYMLKNWRELTYENELGDEDLVKWAEDYISSMEQTIGEPIRKHMSSRLYY